MARARELGVEDHVVFLDQFVDQRNAARLHLHVRRLCHALSQRSADDVRHTGLQFWPGQSGGLDALLARAELLADGRGVLVPFGDAAAIGSEIARIADATTPAGRPCASAPMSASRSMTWERNCRTLPRDLRKCPARGHRLRVIARPDRSERPLRGEPRAARCRSTICCPCATTPDFSSTRSIRSLIGSHGYCVDDNARALLLACALNASR